MLIQRQTEQMIFSKPLFGATFTYMATSKDKNGKRREKENISKHSTEARFEKNSKAQMKYCMLLSLCKFWK